MNRLVLSEVAAQAVVDQFDYYNDQGGIELARRWESAAGATLESLQTWPEQAAKRSMTSKLLQGIRSQSVQGFPNHLVFYFFHQDDRVVHIVHVLHGARDLEAHLLASLSDEG